MKALLAMAELTINVITNRIAWSHGAWSAAASDLSTSTVIALRQL
jgi:hypothetical protein